MARMTVYLNNTEREALQILAEREYRDPRLQAALMIRRELVRVGLLPAAPIVPQSIRAAEAQPTRAEVWRVILDTLAELGRDDELLFQQW